MKEPCRVDTVAPWGGYVSLPCHGCWDLQTHSYSEPVSGVQKSFSSKGFERESAIVLNLNGFRARRADGCVHSQTRRSVVHKPLFSLFNRSLSFFLSAVFGGVFITAHLRQHTARSAQFYFLLLFHSLIHSTSLFSHLPIFLSALRNDIEELYLYSALCLQVYTGAVFFLRLEKQNFSQTHRLRKNFSFQNWI